MSSFIKPQYTDSRIRAASKRIVKGSASVEDVMVFENHRAAHAYPLNNFQMNARKHSKKFCGKVGQRLKRRNTILDKLRREPSMPLPAMQDIAGCRILVSNQDQLYAVRDSLNNARSLHRRLNDENRYDYIKSPKPSGYRAVHDIYEYVVSRSPGDSWNGLKVEIQFRTQAQQAWATAVEVADLITTKRIKFSEADADYMSYFRLASEVIARTAENQKSCLPNIPDRQLADDFMKQEAKLGLLGTFSNLSVSEVRKSRFRPNTLLIFKLDHVAGGETLEIRNYDSASQAIEAYNQLEKDLGSSADIVLVRGENEESIRDVFRNYFSDARAFITLMDQGLVALQG